MVRNKSNSACTHIHKAAWQNVPMQRYNFFPIQQVFQRNKAHNSPPSFYPLPRIVLQNCHFWNAKVAVLERKSGSFRTQKWQF